MAGVGKCNAMQHRINSSAAILRRNTRELRVIVEKLARREVIVEIWLLGQEPDLRLHRRIIQLAVENLRRTACGKSQPHQQLERGCLSGTIRSQEAEYFAALHREGQRI